MQPLFSFWAKLGGATWPDQYHPVLCHLIDVAVVVSNLWERIIRCHQRQWLSKHLGLDIDTCGPWLAFWCGAHDIGKVALCFQDRGQKTAALCTRLSQAGYDRPTGDAPHGVLSTVILDRELSRAPSWPAVDSTVARNIAIAVGGHHGFFPTNWEDLSIPLGKERWAAARREILAELARLCGVVELRPPTATGEDQSVWMYLAGLTSVADWIGSNQEFFQPVGNLAVADGHFDVEEYFKLANARAVTALEKLGWLDRADSTAPVTFTELFPSITTPRPLQTAMAEMVAGVTEPRLLIVEAPMGEGKTEAAWHAAACWDRCGGQGAYVALPTMATSNQMFDRVGAFLEHGPGKKNLMLLHGKAALNDRFEELKYAAAVYDDEKHPSAVVAEGWFAANKKHGMLAPYGVGTIDQALLAVLQTKHVFVRLFGLAGKCVILDEVHAYDAYMITLMEQLLRWLAALGCTVVVLSATLPQEKRRKLLSAYSGHELDELDAIRYPRVTSVAVGGHPEVKPIEADPARARTVQLGWLTEENLEQKLRQALADGGCAAVIRNTVRLAQDTYLRLRDALKHDGITVELLHARFPFGQRKSLEDAVLQRFGKEGGPKERDKRVLVATQVVEQSLDLDFDLLVTDVAPIDLVLQRAGRLHRHARGARPSGVANPQVWLIEPEVEEELPQFGCSERVYARFVLLRSYLALKAISEQAGVVRLPDDLERCVEQVYGRESLIIPDGWQLALDESGGKWEEKQMKQRLNARDVAIFDPDKSPLEQVNLQLEEDDPEAAKKIQAQTRDSDDPTIQLIVIYRLENRDFLDPGGHEPFNEADEPNVKRICRILDNEVTVNHRGCVAFYTPRQGPKRWHDKALLRHHRLVRVDGNGQSLPDSDGGHFFLRVDPQLGLRLTEY